MALILDGKYPATRQGVKAFYVNRILRLYPTYITALVFSLLIAAVSQNRSDGYYSGIFARYGTTEGTLAIFAVVVQVLILGQDVLLYLGYSPTSGVFFTKDFAALPSSQQEWRLALIPPAWSLSVELAFYTLAPYLVRTRTIVLVALPIASIAARVLLRHHFPINNDPWSYRFLPLELGTFCLGVLAYRVYRLRPDLQCPTWVKAATPYASVAGVLFVAKLPYALIWAPAVLLLIVPPLFSLTKTSKVDRLVGELSYPIYLFHWPIIGFIQAHHLHPVFPIALGATLLVSYLVVRWIDVPVDRLRQRLAKKFDLHEGASAVSQETLPVSR